MKTRRRQGGGGGKRTKEKEGDPTKPPQPTTNPTVNKLKSAHPGMTIPKFAVECGMTTHQFVVGAKGGCSNYQLLGKCENKNCGYKHIACTVTDTKQNEVAARILEVLKVIEAKKTADKA